MVTTPIIKEKIASLLKISMTKKKIISTLILVAAILSIKFIPADYISEFTDLILTLTAFIT